MPSAEAIQQYVAAAWRLMTGKPDGMRQLDLSVDGFWTSFYAILVALPPMLLMWIALANERLASGTYAGTRTTLLIAYAIVDLAAWILPLVALAFAAKPAGLGDRFVAYVVATNWASVLVAWIMLPMAVLSLLSPGSSLLDPLLFALFILTCVLMWRLTNAVIGKGPGVASAVFAAMLIASLMTVSLLSALLGIGPETSGG